MTANRPDRRNPTSIRRRLPKWTASSHGPEWIVLGRLRSADCFLFLRGLLMFLGQLHRLGAGVCSISFRICGKSVDGGQARATAPPRSRHRRGCRRPFKMFTTRS